MKWPKYSKKWLMIALVTITLSAMMVMYSYLSWESVHMPLLRFSAPDEQANYFFTKLFAEQSVLSYPEPLLEVSQDFVHTRSMTASHGEVKPVGFLGFSLIYGTIAKVFTIHAIPFFTPILAIIAVLFFYIAVEKIFNKKVAMVASMLLLIHPAYWYYSARALMPNVLFMDLLVIGLTLIIVASTGDRKSIYSRKTASLVNNNLPQITVLKRVIPLTKILLYYVQRFFYTKVVLFFLGGFFIALSLTVRLSESLWVGTLIGLMGLLYLRRLSIWRVLCFIVGFSIPIAVLLSYNYALYGNILSSGYKMIDTTVSTQAVAQSISLISHGQFIGIMPAIKSIVRPYMPLLLPFGYRPDIFWDNARNYLVFFFWWFTIPTVAGVILVIRNQTVQIVRHRVPHRLWYVLLWIGVTGWLIVFYGSWKLTDNINGGVTLGVSYVRYWLPSYIMALPLVASLFVWLFEKGRSSIARRSAVVGLLGVMLIMSASTVLIGGQESLADMKQQLENTQEKAQAVFRLTPSNAVIFSPRSDKLFFPERKVAGSFSDFPERYLITTLIQKAPVYYYGLWNQDAARYISKTYFEPLGLRWSYVDTIAPREQLYRIDPISTP